MALLNPVVGLILNASLWLLWIRLCYRSADAVEESAAAALRRG